MNNFYSLSYQQSDDDYQADFNYNCTQPNYTRKSITNTSVILSDNVYKSLFKMHPSDAYIFGINCEPQNVINV